MKKIIKNAIKCNLCGDIIESLHKHDYKSCLCGAVFVDGGTDYLRRGYTNSQNDFTELSQFEKISSKEMLINSNNFS